VHGKLRLELIFFADISDKNLKDFMIREKFSINAEFIDIEMSNIFQFKLILPRFCCDEHFFVSLNDQIDRSLEQQRDKN
jgi:hypothetical protein